MSELTATVQALPVANFQTGEQLRDFFATHYGPTIAAYRNVADDAARTAELDAAIVEVAERFGVTSGAMQWEYLLVTATV